MVRTFFLDVQRRVNDAVYALHLEAGIIDFAIHAFGGFPIPILTTAVGLSAKPTDLGEIAALPDLPALPDMRTNSVAVQEQNSRFDDTGIARASVTGSIPFQFAVFRIQASLDNNEAEFADLRKRRNQAMSAFQTCKIIGYATIILNPVGRKCSYGRKVLGRIDERWVRYVNGTDAAGRVRRVPFDGIVPNDHQQYPGLSDPLLKLHVNNTNHQNIFKVSPGVNSMATAMLRMRMRPTGAGGGTTALSVSLSGPTSISMEGSYSWTANATGGIGSYTYRWEISRDGGESWTTVGSARSYSIYASGTDAFDLRATVFSGTQSSTKQKSVYIDTGCGGPYIC